MNEKIKHLALISGGEASALVAIHVAKKYGRENVTLINHDINPKYENQDIKRFKQDVADYIGLPITYVNYKGITNANEIPSQFDVCLQNGGQLQARKETPFVRHF